MATATHPQDPPLTAQTPPVPHQIQKRKRKGFKTLAPLSQMDQRRGRSSWSMGAQRVWDPIAGMQWRHGGQQPEDRRSDQRQPSSSRILQRKSSCRKKSSPSDATQSLGINTATTLCFWTSFKDSTTRRSHKIHQQGAPSSPPQTEPSELWRKRGADSPPRRKERALNRLHHSASSLLLSGREMKETRRSIGSYCWTRALGSAPGHGAASGDLLVRSLPLEDGKITCDGLSKLMSRATKW